MPEKRNGSELGKRARSKLNRQPVGVPTAAFVDYHLEGTVIKRNTPKVKMSKKERRRVREVRM